MLNYDYPIYEHKSSERNFPQLRFFCLYGLKVSGPEIRHLPTNHPTNAGIKSHLSLSRVPGVRVWVPNVLVLALKTHKNHVFVLLLLNHGCFFDCFFFPSLYVCLFWFNYSLLGAHSVCVGVGMWACVCVRSGYYSYFHIIIIIIRPKKI